MSDKPFRVLLDLTDLKIQSFKYVWISISPREIRTIANFKMCLLQKINLAREDIKLFVRDGLLLEEETIAVLREDDTVKVQYEGQISYVQDPPVSNLSPEQKKSRKRYFDECSQKEAAENTKKHKRSKSMVINKDEVMSTDTNINSKTKHSLSHGENRNNKIQDLEESASFSSEAVSNLARKSKKKKAPELEKISCQDNSSKSKISTNDLLINSNSNKNAANDSKENYVQSSITEAAAESTVGATNNCKKKKRKRSRKRKQGTEPAAVIDVSCPVDPGSVFKSALNTFKSSKRKHIIFSSPNPHTEPVYSESTDLITLDYDESENNLNISSETYNKENSSLIEPQISFTKASTPAQANGNVDPNWDVSLMPNENTKYTNHASCSTEKAVKPKDKGIIEEDVTLNKICKSLEKENLNYADFPPLTSQPEIGAYIAYKVLELDQNYSPTVSEYREGVVQSIDLQTDEMVIQLLKHHIKPGRIGKFENLREDEMPFPEIKKEDSVSWTALIEPKLLS